MKKKVSFLLLCLFISIGVVSAQTTPIKGVVLSAEDNEPIIGASILVKGTTMGTVTDLDGVFSLHVPSSTNTLVISFIGMASQEVIAASNIRVLLKPDTQNLEEVIVVAYGTAKKTSFTGSASSVNAAAIDKRSLTSVVSALEGNASGVQVTSSIGQPGESANVRIRGFGSVNASNAPLYILDGAIFKGEIANINPADIESITILKDAASTSLYGSSAGNGVVLITTKRGKSAASVNLNITQGWSARAYNDYARVNTMEYYPLQWEMLKQTYISAKNTPEEAANKASNEIVSRLKYNPFVGIEDHLVVGLDGLLNPNATQLKWGDDLDWENEAYGSGNRQEYNLSYSSQTDKSDTYASLAYLDDKGYMLKTDFERYSGRINYNISPNKWFKSGVNLSMSRTQSNYSSSTESSSSSYSNLTRFVRTMAPIYPVHKHDLKTGEYMDTNGKVTTNPAEYIYDYDGSRLSNNGRDAIAETKLNMRHNSRVNTMGKGYITIIPLEGLNITTNYTLDNTDLRRKVYENPHVGDGTAGPARLSIRSTRTLSQTFNQLLNYTKSFDKHSFDFLFGHENFSYKYEYLYSMKVGEIIPNIYDLMNFTAINNLTSYTLDYKKEGYFARLNYDFDNKYYASVSYRRDGSSRFSKENRWGDFWSFGASWRISQEEWIRNLTWINNLKLRASYGETGNDAILDKNGSNDYYPYMELYELGVNNSSEPGTYFSTLANQNLLWETQISTDLALEFSLFDRLSGTIEYFKKSSKDLLFDVSQPTSTGASSMIQNIGKVKNEGLEIELTYQFLRNKDWKASFGINNTFISNEIVRLPDVNKENGIINGSKKLIEGKSIYEFWLRQWYGVDPKTGNGLYIFDSESFDATNTNVKNSLVEIDGKQLTNSYTYAKYDYSGSAVPKVYGGFNLNVSYKSFDLGAVFSYSLGGKLIDNTYSSLMNMDSYGYAMHNDVKKAWKKEGDLSHVPRLDNNGTHATNIGQGYSTRWITSSDYLNFRSVTLGYNLPKSLLNTIQVKETRVNLSVENLFMLKARQGLNPQGNYKGITYNEYLPARTITLGINVSF